MIASFIWLSAPRIPRSLIRSVTNRIDRQAALWHFSRESFLTQEGMMIKKAEGGYKVLSEKGKNLGGPYKTKKEAEKRLQQVEFFKHKKG
jgi:hypothetical protein